MSIDNIQTAEFKLLKEELGDRERAMGSLIMFATVSSVSLLSALFAVAMKDIPLHRESGRLRFRC
jgi:hypothetical protein